MVTAKQFIDMCVIPYKEGWGYIYGQWGATWTAAKQAAATREMTVRYGAKWIGKRVTDCSGLIRWALDMLGETIVHHARYQYTDHCTNKGKLIGGRREDGTLPLPGSAVFLQGSQAHIHHVGAYVGHDVVVEAKGTNYGVVTSHLSHWDHWGELKVVDYTGAAELESVLPEELEQEDAQSGTVVRAVACNPQSWLNVRALPESGAAKLFQIPKGATVEVLDAGEPEWWQVRYGGRVGWCYAEYLRLLEDEDGEQEEASCDQTGESCDQTGASCDHVAISQDDAKDAAAEPEPSPATVSSARCWAELVRIRETLDKLGEEIDRLREIIEEGWEE